MFCQMRALRPLKDSFTFLSGPRFDLLADGVMIPPTISTPLDTAKVVWSFWVKFNACSASFLKLAVAHHTDIGSDFQIDVG